MYRNVLVCLGNPRHAEEMTRLALAVAEKDVRLVFLRAVKRATQEALKQLEADLSFMRNFRVRGKAMKFEKRLVEGRDIARIIIDTGRKNSSDLIVIGATPHKGVLSRLSGDITKEVMEKSGAAVVTVKSRT